MAFDYERLQVEIDGGVAFATIDNPPINVMTLELFADLLRFGSEAAADEASLIVACRSPCRSMSALWLATAKSCTGTPASNVMLLFWI